MEAYDILLEDDTFKPKFANGTLVIGKSDPQHIDHLLRAAPGQYYQFPKIGINVKKFTLGNSGRQEIQQDVRQGLEADNYNVKDVIITEEELNSVGIITNAERIK